ncbi:MAG: hypothetical protein IPF92_06535 [Myxococcales bacterium]|nr:hypothetical protein [Myxococcales bacterium]MBL0192701.1 hypothetical protein [Myxococcales bacterium]HQY62689.1 hypothetical protein [Polyangiaceae bacterium]
MSLRPCAACERHRRDAEPCCPFCGERSLLEPAGRSGDVALRTRAALVFGGVALAAAAAVSCAPKYGGPPPLEPAPPAPSTTTPGAPAAPPGDAGPQPPSVVPLYGAPPDVAG